MMRERYDLVSVDARLTSLLTILSDDRLDSGKKIERIGQFLDSDPDRKNKIMIQDSNGAGVLTYAIIYGDLEVLEHMLALLLSVTDIKTEINEKDDFGYTPLMHAVAHKKYNMLWTLLESGSDVAGIWTEEKKANILMFVAASNLSLDEKKWMLMFLFAHSRVSALINDADADGHNVLTHILYGNSSRDEKEELIQFLKERGAAVRGEDKEDLHALLALDLDYWLSGNDLDVALKAVELKKIDETWGFKDEGEDSRFIILGPVGPQSIISFLKYPKVTLDNIFLEKSKTTILIPVFAGHHTIAMKIEIVKKDNVGIASAGAGSGSGGHTRSISVSFFDPHGLRDRQIPEFFNDDFKENLEKFFGEGEITINYETYKRQQFEEGQCSDFVLFYILSQTSSVEEYKYNFAEKASKDRDFEMRKRTFFLIHDMQGEDHRKKDLLLCLQKIYCLNQSDQARVFEIKLQKIYDSALINNDFNKKKGDGYFTAEFKEEFTKILDSNKTYEDLVASYNDLFQFNQFFGGLLENFTLIKIITKLLIKGNGDSDITGKIDSLIKMFLPPNKREDVAALSEAYSRVREIAIPLLKTSSLNTKRTDAINPYQFKFFMNPNDFFDVLQIIKHFDNTYEFFNKFYEVAICQNTYEKLLERISVFGGEEKEEPMLYAEEEVENLELRALNFLRDWTENEYSKKEVGLAGGVVSREKIYSYIIEEIENRIKETILKLGDSYNIRHYPSHLNFIKSLESPMKHPDITEAPKTPRKPRPHSFSFITSPVEPTLEKRIEHDEEAQRQIEIKLYLLFSNHEKYVDNFIEIFKNNVVYRDFIASKKRAETEDDKIESFKLIERELPSIELLYTQFREALSRLMSPLSNSGIESGSETMSPDMLLMSPEQLPESVSSLRSAAKKSPKELSGLISKESAFSPEFYLQLQEIFYPELKGKSKSFYGGFYEKEFLEYAKWLDCHFASEEFSNSDDYYSFFNTNLKLDAAKNSKKGNEKYIWYKVRDKIEEELPLQDGKYTADHEVRYELIREAALIIFKLTFIQQDKTPSSSPASLSRHALAEEGKKREEGKY